MTTTLITGGAGFIGSHLAEALLANGYRVIAYDNFNEDYDPQLKRDNIAAALECPSYKVIAGDIRDTERLSGLIRAESVDYLYHLAARAGVRESLENPEAYEDVNIRGTRSVLQACKGADITRLVFASSSSVYGLASKVPNSEVDPLLYPVSPYAATKIAGEALCHVYGRLYHIPVTCARFFTVYGPRQRPNMAINKFARMIERGEPIAVHGDGLSRRDYTYISDVADGLVRMAIAPQGQFEVINLGSGRPITLRQVVEALELALDRKAEIRLVPDVPGDVPVTCADIRKARAVLGYYPRVPFAGGTRRFVQWLRGTGVTEGR